MKWTKHEVAILQAYYENVSWIKLLKLLPGRNKCSIKTKARQLSLNRGKFTIKGGEYHTYFRCEIHGKIYKEEVIKWKGIKAYCPRLGCNKELRRLPKRSKLRRKYRIESKVEG